MSKRKTPRVPPRVPLAMLSTGVPGLDEVLGGGLPALSFNLVAGGPGSGKTTMAMQFLFANSSPKRPGLFITLLGETSLKMLRYQQQFEFFDMSRVGRDVHFLNLTEEALAGDLEVVLARITEEVDALHPGVVIVDSFRSLIRLHPVSKSSDLKLEHFVQRLALHLTTWEICSFLIGEYLETELRNPVFTVADGIFWLTQATHRNSVVRKLQIVKLRGSAQMPGLHTLKITPRGLQVFPRIPEWVAARTRKTERLSTGIVGFDQMLGGGIPAGDSFVLAGPTGSGKTTFAMQYVAAGLSNDEAAVIAIFEEHPDSYLKRAKDLGVDFTEAVRKKKLAIIYLRPLDLSVDETLDEIRRAVQKLGAKRVVIDSISGFEMALAPTFRDDFRESLYRLIGALTGLGVTIYSTVEVTDTEGGLRLTGYQVSFLTDDIVNLRYVEVAGALQKTLVVMKMRGSAHSREFRAYDLTNNGVLLRDSMRDYDDISSGTPIRQLRGVDPSHPGLVEQERTVLGALMRAGTVSLAELSAVTGVDKAGIARIMERLTELRYVTRKGSRFEADAQPRPL